MFDIYIILDVCGPFKNWNARYESNLRIAFKKDTYIFRCSQLRFVAKNIDIKG